jgi:Cdc6-like AAA superfamily ATPase
MSWLCSADPSVNHGNACKLRVGDTGSWLIDSPAYSDWYHRNGCLFWLYGIAGSGKTILCSTLIEKVQERNAADADHDLKIAYVYFSIQDLSKQTTDYLVRSLLRQLSSGRSMTWTAIAELYHKCSMVGQQPSQTALLNLLVQAVEESSRTFIMVDALDECTDKEDAFDIIIQLFERLPGKVNLLVTSRHETFIEDSLSDIDTHRWEKVPLRNAAADEDISTFVKSRMEKDRKLRKWRTLSDFIVETLISQAGGM